MSGMGAPARLGDEYRGRAGAILGRVQALYPKLIDLSLDRLVILLGKLGHPERALPPVIHVAGTNGKGSTCATLRAIAESAGWRVHVMTSPHLVSVTERFRIAGELVSEEALVAALEEIEQVNGAAPITVFEVLTAAGFLLFSRSAADLAIIEVGLGGRLDATNVVLPAACAISAISLDHQAFLGETIAAIAAEKAGIMKAGVPVVVAPQQPGAAAVLRAEAARLGAPLWALDEDIQVGVTASGVAYADPHGSLALPMPGLRGPHQVQNAALAVAALRASGLPLPGEAFGGIAQASWPARLQRLHGDLAARLPAGWELWLDGGHNPGASAVLAEELAGWRDRPVHLIIGMKQTKDPAGFLAPLLGMADTIQAVAEPRQHLAIPVDEIVAASGGMALAGPVVASALDRLAATAPSGGPARVLICGSLYLAGVVLEQDGSMPR